MAIGSFTREPTAPGAIGWDYLKPSPEGPEGLPADADGEVGGARVEDLHLELRSLLVELGDGLLDHAALPGGTQEVALEVQHRRVLAGLRVIALTESGDGLEARRGAGEQALGAVSRQHGHGLPHRRGEEERH